jgi:hypothetical protein
MIKAHLEPTEEGLDSFKETRYCINKSKEYLEREKKEEFLNKLCFEYSLAKINKEKYLSTHSESTEESFLSPQDSTLDFVSLLIISSCQ